MTPRQTRRAARAIMGPRHPARTLAPVALAAALVGAAGGWLAGTPYHAPPAPHPHSMTCQGPAPDGWHVCTVPTPGYPARVRVIGWEDGSARAVALDPDHATSTHTTTPEENR